MTDSQRREATWIRKSLDRAEQRVADGEKDIEVIRKGIHEDIESNTSGVIDYIGLVNPDTFEAMDSFVRPLLAVMTVRFGETRLLDNTLL